jgi:tRNA (guanine37-N1)-methyltransferase
MNHNLVMNITVLTMVPEQFQSFFLQPLVKRAIQKNLLHLQILDIRDYVKGSFRHIDDSPCGGGPGMIIRCEPVFQCLDHIRKENSHLIAFAPSGIPYTQHRAAQLAEKEDLILLCGHYEGFDQRILDHADEILSIGDYVLSGGEIPAMAVIDSIVRLLEGTIRKESTAEESFENGLLEYPQYTRPRSFRGMKVPEVLLSGNAENIRKWKLRESLRITAKNRPDLLRNRTLNKEEAQMLEEIRNEEEKLERNSHHGD